MASILIIDDEKSIRKSLKDILEFEKFQISEAADGSEGFNLASSQHFDLIICDIKMPKMDGLDFLNKANELQIEAPIIIMSGHGTIETAVEAVKKGAYDFLAKPIDLNRLLVAVRNGLEKKILVNETKTLRKKSGKQGEMIGNSVSLNEIKSIIEKVAPTDARVLITGANGSGKELVARAIHNQSNRNNAPLIEVNCAAIPPDLIESELFGHEKGAFTSAVASRKGKFELAEGGTLFLDEIGDMSLSAQAKVLRALQESKITRVGGDKEIKVNVRVLAATNKSLKEEIKNGNFREDLFHRLNVIPVHVPSLDERKEDIPLLIEHFATIIAGEYGTPARKFSKEAIKALQGLTWSGNIRELRNVVERLIILGGKEISEADVRQFVSK